MSCPPNNEITQPFPMNTYECNDQHYLIDSFICDILMKASYFQYLKTAIKNSSEYRNKYQYITPIYTFQYYSYINNKYVKTYTYDKLFNLNLLAMRYNCLAKNLPQNILNDFDDSDSEIFNNIHLFNDVDNIYNAITTANKYKSLGKDYYFTYNLPKLIFNNNEFPGQCMSKKYNRDELITISRNAPILQNL